MATNVNKRHGLRRLQQLASTSSASQTPALTTPFPTADKTCPVQVELSGKREKLATLKDGGAEGVRTPDLLNAIQEFTQTCRRVRRLRLGGGGWCHPQLKHPLVRSLLRSLP